MAAKPSRAALLQAIWRRAFAIGELEIAFPTPRDAIRTRMELYNVVKKVRMQPTLDPELAKAVEHCSISFKSNTVLIIREKVAEDWLMEAAEGLGIDTSQLQEAPKTKLEADARDSLKRMQERMAADAAEAAATEARKSEPVPDMNTYMARYGYRGGND